MIIISRSCQEGLLDSFFRVEINVCQIMKHQKGQVNEENKNSNKNNNNNLWLSMPVNSFFFFILLLDKVQNI